MASSPNALPLRLRQAAGWFDPRARQAGGLAFILNRLSALGLTLYLFVHLGVLSTLLRGPQAYDTFIAFAHHPLVLAGEYLVVAAGLLHGLNGIRVAVTSLAVGVPYQKQLFYGLMALAAAGCLYFAIRMFGGGA